MSLLVIGELLNESGPPFFFIFLLFIWDKIKTKEILYSIALIWLE